jgi:hypothetical protein
VRLGRTAAHRLSGSFLGQVYQEHFPDAVDHVWIGDVNDEHGQHLLQAYVRACACVYVLVWVSVSVCVGVGVCMGRH